MDPSELNSDQTRSDASSAPQRQASYRPQRARWPGLVGAAAILAAVVALVAWSRHDNSRHALGSSETGTLAQRQRQEAPGDSVNSDLAMTDSATAAIAVAPAKQ